MKPVVTPTEMAAIDAAAPEPVGVLIERAGVAVARVARSMMGGTYGRVVNVIVGKGNNGNDGRVAATRLADDGVVVRVFDAAECPAVLPRSDLVIDAAYGTGFRGEWKAPDVGGSKVLAVDIPSGVDGLTGVASGAPLIATRTVTFAALKPGLLYADGPRVAGTIDVADIGLDVSVASAHLVGASDVAAWRRPRPRDDHKWSRAVRIVAGSPGMTGAASLCSAAAMRAGAGIVWLSSPGADPAGDVVEVVGKRVPASRWAGGVIAEIDRFAALVVGPGLGRAETTPADVSLLLERAGIPAVVDGDGLYALSAAKAGRSTLRNRTVPTVLSPHEGEYRLLMGESPGPDRIEAARRLAVEWCCVAILKGPTTTIAAPDGQVRIVTEGDERLATAGTGDVLSGILGALLAAGLDPLDAAASAAWIHAAAGNALPREGLVASDLLGAIPGVIGSQW